MSDKYIKVFENNSCEKKTCTICEYSFRRFYIAGKKTGTGYKITFTDYVSYYDKLDMVYTPDWWNDNEYYPWTTSVSIKLEYNNTSIEIGGCIFKCNYLLLTNTYCLYDVTSNTYTILLNYLLYLEKYRRINPSYQSNFNTNESYSTSISRQSEILYNANSLPSIVPEENMSNVVNNTIIKIPGDYFLLIHNYPKSKTSKITYNVNFDCLKYLLINDKSKLLITPDKYQDFKIDNKNYYLPFEKITKNGLCCKVDNNNYSAYQLDRKLHYVFLLQASFLIFYELYVTFLKKNYSIKVVLDITGTRSDISSTTTASLTGTQEKDVNKNDVLVTDVLIFPPEKYKVICSVYATNNINKYANLHVKFTLFFYYVYAVVPLWFGQVESKDTFYKSETTETDTVIETIKTYKSDVYLDRPLPYTIFCYASGVSTEELWRIEAGNCIPNQKSKSYGALKLPEFSKTITIVYNNQIIYSITQTYHDVSPYNGYGDKNIEEDIKIPISTIEGDVLIAEETKFYTDSENEFIDNSIDLPEDVYFKEDPVFSEEDRLYNTKPIIKYKSQSGSSSSGGSDSSYNYDVTFWCTYTFMIHWKDMKSNGKVSVELIDRDESNAGDMTFEISFMRANKKLINLWKSSSNLTASFTTEGPISVDGFPIEFVLVSGIEMYFNGGISNYKVNYNKIVYDSAETIEDIQSTTYFNNKNITHEEKLKAIFVNYDNINDTFVYEFYENDVKIAKCYYKQGELQMCRDVRNGDDGESNPDNWILYNDREFHVYVKDNKDIPGKPDVDFKKLKPGNVLTGRVLYYEKVTVTNSTSKTNYPDVDQLVTFRISAANLTQTLQLNSIKL